MSRPTMFRMIPALAFGVAVGCSGDSAKPVAGGDTARPMVASDTSGRAREVSVTPEQSKRIQVAPVEITSYRASIQTTGTVAFNGDRSTQVLAPVSGPITKILVNPGTWYGAVSRWQW